MATCLGLNKEESSQVASRAVATCVRSEFMQR